MVKKYKRPVVAIPPSYYADGTICIDETERYLNYLWENDVTWVMSTAGTSQFNLLDYDEIIAFNSTLSEFPGLKILGLPPLSTNNVVRFIQDQEDNLIGDNYLMALYPDRFYTKDAIINYVDAICEEAQNQIYLHTQKMRNGTSGDWVYHADVINEMYDKGLVCGIKEEHPNLQESYNFVRGLYPDIHVIVAGGSMRRYTYLKSAGADTFLSGVGNMFPCVENSFVNKRKRKDALELESYMFDVFGKYGWHRSLRYALNCLDLCCAYNRDPWPEYDDDFTNDIQCVISELQTDVGDFE